MTSSDAGHLLSNLQMLSDDFHRMESQKFSEKKSKEGDDDASSVSILDFVEETTAKLLFPPDQPLPPSYEEELEFVPAVHRRIGEITRAEIFTALEKRPDVVKINASTIENLREAISMAKGRGGRDRIASRLATDLRLAEAALANNLVIAN